MARGRPTLSRSELAQDRIDPGRVEAAYSRVAKIYDSCYEDAQSRAEDEEVTADVLYTWERLLRLPVLDVGCGTGWLLGIPEFAALRRCDYLGIDPCAAMLEIAKKRHPGKMFMRRTFESFDPELFPVASPDGRFIVCTYGGVSYCPDPERMAQKVLKLSRPKGGFYLMAYGPGHNGGRVFAKQKMAPPASKQYRVEDLEALFKNQGLKFLDSYYMGEPGDLAPGQFAVVNGRW